MLAQLTNSDTPQPCALCHDTGWHIIIGVGAKPCECRKRNQYERALKQARIPQRYANCTLDNYEPNGAPGSDEIVSQATAKLACKGFVQHYPNVDFGLLIVGECGLGKTHLAVAVLKEIIAKNISPCLFYDFRDLLKEIQDSYNPSTSTSELQVLAPIYEAELLVLDELGATKPTTWMQDTMTQIINKRYNDKKLTIFTSNFLDTTSLNYEETLSERLGVRLRSRLYEMCKLIHIKGDDFRRSKLQHNRF